jgi:hypothetical protein
MMFPLVRDLAADKIPVAVTCRVLGFSTQAYYKWLANPVSQRDWDDAHLVNAGSISIMTTRSSATGSSPTSCPLTASPRAALGYLGTSPDDAVVDNFFRLTTAAGIS